MMEVSAQAGSQIMCSTSTGSAFPWKYDVFLSFRGENTCKGFIDLLYKELQRRGIRTFREDPALERGTSISADLLAAIEQSRFAIVVLSPNYASSARCLVELSKILECMERRGTILPVFYNVDPSDVRHQTGRFTQAFDDHELFGKDSKEVKGWRDALTKVANLSGWDSKDWYEAELMREIEQVLCSKLSLTVSDSSEKLVGVHTKLEEIDVLLDKEANDVSLIGISGMGELGSGYNINNLFQEAQRRWLKPAEVLCILQNHEKFKVAAEPPQQPVSGSLFLFNKRILQFFHRDGHNWRTTEDGRTVREAHERLKVGNFETLNCYHVNGEDNPNFQRRSYWMLDPAHDHIVLVHYRKLSESPGTTVMLSSSKIESLPESLEILDSFRIVKDADEHETLPHHLKRLFLYCSLFPFGYEFSKDELVQLWIAEGFIRESQRERMEDTASESFNSLEKEGFFVYSRCDFAMDFDSVVWASANNPGNFLYKVNPIKNSLLEYTISSGIYFKAVDGILDGASEMTRHLSLINEDIDGMAFGVLQNFKHLRTLHVLSSHGSFTKQVPRDLCFTLTFLRTLNLSGTWISELPSSIGNVKSLRYVDASHTRIARLPESIDSLHNLQTIKLRDCTHFVELPKGMKKLTNLRHIDLDIIRQLDSMPAHLGNLTNLQTLSAFFVGRDDGCHVGELKNLNDLKGGLNISRLENVASKKEAEEAALIGKKCLHTLEFRWSDVFVEYAEQEEEILECLQPHSGLKVLHIHQYSGSVLPTWISNPAFADLVAITLYKCRNCKLLPCMGQLPALKSLSIIEMNEVKYIDHQFLRNGSGEYAFPKLERLEVDIMLNLKEWKHIQRGDFPSLVKLIVDSCPELERLPPLACHESLKHLELRRCPKLLSLPSDGQLPHSLESFVLVDCLVLKEWCLKSEHWITCHMSSIWFDDKKVSEEDCTPLWGCVSVCGKRREMEDTITAVPRFINIPITMLIGSHVYSGISQSFTHLASHFFGVYDGHGGPEVAKYCSERLHLALADELQIIQDDLTDGILGETQQVKWEKVFTSCFRRVDDEIGEISSRRITGSKEDASRVNSDQPDALDTIGSTAVVALVCSSHIIVANCGDSRAVLFRGKKTIPLSVDHKANREDECARIEASGGKIIQWDGYRVFGVLPMSRSIGDRYLKPWVIPDPEVMIVPRKRDDEFLILATDGLWDVMTNEEACKVARRRIRLWHKTNRVTLAERGTGVDPASQEAASYLSTLALQKGSSDNISVILVDLGFQRKLKSKYWMKKV